MPRHLILVHLKHLAGTPCPVLGEAEPGTWGQSPGDDDLGDLGGRGHAVLPAPATPPSSARLSLVELGAWPRLLFGILPRCPLSLVTPLQACPKPPSWCLCFCL